MTQADVSNCSRCSQQFSSQGPQGKPQLNQSTSQPKTCKYSRLLAFELTSVCPFRERAQEKEDLEKTYKENNDSIRQILKEMAKILQRPDTEAQFLRRNVLLPANLNKYNLSPFIGKTIQLDVG